MKILALACLGFFALSIVTSSYPLKANENSEVVKAVKTIEFSTQSANGTVSAPAQKCYVESKTLRPEEISEAIDQSKSTPKDYCSGNEIGAPAQRYLSFPNEDETRVGLSTVYKVNNLSKEKMTEGFRISSPSGASMPVIEEGQVITDADLTSPEKSFSWDFLGRGKEMSFTVIDTPVRDEFDPKTKKVKERFLSTNFRMTNYYYFPRKVIPAVSTTESEFVVTMTTGEKITYDRRTGNPIAGVAGMVPSTNRVVKRAGYTETFSDKVYKYKGEGLFLEAPVTYDHDARETGGTVVAKGIVGGVEQACSLKSDDLFVRDYGYNLKKDEPGYLNSCWNCTRFKFEKDEDLYKMIKLKCPTFKFPALAN